MARHHHRCLAVVALALLVASAGAFMVPSTAVSKRSRPSSVAAASSSGREAGDAKQPAEGLLALRWWLHRAWTLAAPVGVMVALPLAGAPMRAGAAFDVDGISKALQEDTSKKYQDEGLGLVETLKKRSVQNKAKHDRELMEKAFLNSEAGIYGPFDKFVPVMKKDGQYVLLAEDEYNRLKGEGKIVGRDFVVDYKGDSAPEAVTPDEPAVEQKEEGAAGGGLAGSGKSMLDDDADLLDGVTDAELL